MCVRKEWWERMNIQNIERTHIHIHALAWRWYSRGSSITRRTHTHSNEKFKSHTRNTQSFLFIVIVIVMVRNKALELKCWWASHILKCSSNKRVWNSASDRQWWIIPCVCACVCTSVWNLPPFLQNPLLISALFLRFNQFYLLFSAQKVWKMVFDQLDIPIFDNTDIWFELHAIDRKLFHWIWLDIYRFDLISIQHKGGILFEFT